MLARVESRLGAAWLLVVAAPTPALAQASSPGPVRSAAAAPVAEAASRASATGAVGSSRLQSGLYYRLFGAAALGRGLRFNNPYRLRTQLGDTGESLSLSATYLDLSVGVALGDPSGLQHAAVVHFSEALTGIVQDAVSPSYGLLQRLAPRWLLLARFGLPIVLRPDTTWGIEAAMGGVYYTTAGTGVTMQLVGSLFYGAATWERSVTAIPMLSLQAGVFFDYEALP